MTTDKVTFVIESLKIGGAERVVTNLATEFDKHGWDVDIVVVQEKGPLEGELPASVGVHLLNVNRTLASVPSLVSYFRRRQPDAVISNMTHVNLIVTFSVKLSRIDTTLVVVEHSLLSERIERINSQKERLTAIFAGQFYPKTDAIVAVSDGLADDIATVTGVNRSSITTVHNPIDIKNVRRQAREAINHEWFQKNRVPVIISVGRIEVRKDYTTLLFAFEDVLKHQDCRLVICGDGPEYEKLHELANKLRIQDKVSFLGWVENPHKYVSRSDVFVLSSIVEGFSNVLVEALAVGCPIVSTDCQGGPAEILEDGNLGRLVPVGDDKAMSIAIRKTLTEKKRKNLRERANAFDIENAYQEYERLCRGKT